MAGPNMVIEKGRVFKDLPTLKRWLQAFAVIRKRPYKVFYSYAERRYTVVCDKERCHRGFVQGSKRSSESGRSQKLSGHTIVLTMC